MEQERQHYINENIIEKGYNPDELFNFITRTKGMEINLISFDELKNLIEQFKNEQLSKTISSIQSKKDYSFDIYSPFEYIINTRKQQESEMMELENENKKINITISEPKIENGGFFSPKIYSFIISSNELNTKVKRTYDDFEWFKNQLNERYPFILIPPIIKEGIFEKININPLNTLNNLNVFKKKDTNNESNKNENYLLELKQRYLTRFFKAVLRKKILRTSPLTLEFLKLEQKDFEKYKKTLNDKPFKLKISLNNLKTIKGEIKVELNQDKMNQANNIPKILSVTQNLYSKLKSSFDNIINDFNNISNHMKELADSFYKLKIQSKEIKHSNDMINLYKNLQLIFNSWSFSYLNQSKFFKDDFWEFFDYNLLEYNEYDVINKQYLNYKNEYENHANKLLNKKENLFQSQNFSKWDVESGLEKDITLFKHDKKASFSLMCYKETKYIEAEKKIVVTAMNMIIEQFNKLKKYQGERAKIYFDGLKERNQTIIGDAFNLIKLFSVKTQ
jgi:hypothetical protein